MKKFVAVLIVAALVVPAMAAPTYFTPDTATLLSMTQQWLGTNTTAGALSVAEFPVASNQVVYAAQLQYGGIGDSGDAIIGIGKAAEDFTGFDGLQLRFENTNNSNWSVNLWYEVNGTYYENGWALLSPGNQVSITLDFAVDVSTITSYGFQIKGYMDYAAQHPNPSNPDTFHITVSPIPAPGAILLGSIGVSLVGWMKRRRSL